jgi:hypothetical protein
MRERKARKRGDKTLPLMKRMKRFSIDKPGNNFTAKDAKDAEEEPQANPCHGFGGK